MTEADELYQNAGEKGKKHSDPDDPPRRRANQFKGHGTWEHDRPPVAGVVGRVSGQLRLMVCHQSDRATLEAFVVHQTPRHAWVYTDEWLPYAHLPESGRAHAQVHHRARPRQWARDEDGDGVREVHCNTLEGLWTGVRNFLRPFRGVNKTELGHYLKVFELGYLSKTITAPILRAMLLPLTLKPT